MQSLRSILWVILAIGLISSSTRADDAVRVDGEKADKVQEEGWGTITGQIRVIGDLPRDPGQQLVVDRLSKGIANVFVYLKAVDRIHPDLKESEEKELIVDTKNRDFVPHALFVRTDQSVRVTNSDPRPASVHVFPMRNPGINVVIPAKDRDGRLIRFAERESLPLLVKSDLNPMQSAFFIVLDHPYGAVTDKDGRYTIANLPAGEHELVVWHEMVGYLERRHRIKVEAGKTTELPPMRVLLPTDERSDERLQQVVAALDAQVEISCFDMPLKDVLKGLSNPDHVAIVIDESSLKAAGIATDTPISRAQDRLSGLLQEMLPPLKLNYIIKDGKIVVVADGAAKE